MSGAQGDGLLWRKASLSDNSGNCVEVALLADGGVAVRDSKSPHGPRLEFTAREWAAFVNGVLCGEFDTEKWPR